MITSIARRLRASGVVENIIARRIGKIPKNNLNGLEEGTVIGIRCN